MAAPYVCAKCGASFEAGSLPADSRCGVCGGSLELPQEERWPWLAAQEWFVLVATIVAGVTAYINS